MTSRAVYKGSFDINGLKIPLAIYKTQDSYGLAANRFHTDCDGAIKMRMYCEDHPDEINPPWFTGIGVNGEVISIDEDVRNSLLGRKTPFTFISARPLRELAFGTEYLAIETFTVARIASNPPLPNDALYTLFETMRRRKVFLVCQIGLSGMERYAILLPNARLITLSYQEELREHEPVAGTFNRDVSELLRNSFETSTEFPKLTCLLHMERVNLWFSKKIAERSKNSKRTASVNPKKQNAKRLTPA